MATNMTLKPNKRMTAPVFMPTVKAWISEHKKAVTDITADNMSQISVAEIIDRFGFEKETVNAEVLNLKGLVEPDYSTVTEKGFDCKYQISGIVLVEVDTDEENTDYLYRITYTADKTASVIGKTVSVKLYRAITD